MRRMILLLAILGACNAPAVQIEPAWTPPYWSMPVAADICSILDAKCPLDEHVVISIEPTPGFWGQSWFDEDKCEYRINVNPVCREPDLFRETVIHEWAHCLTKCECADDHCEHWGIHYAECYRAATNE